MNHLLYEADQGLIKPIEIKDNLLTEEKDQNLDLYPKKQHEIFINKIKKTTHETRNDLLDSNKNWDQLNEVIKNWNRHSYDHLFMKLKYIYHYFNQYPEYQQLECPTRQKTKSIAFNYKERIKVSDEFKVIIKKLRKRITDILEPSQLFQSNSTNDFDELIEHLVNMEQRRWLCEKVIDGFDDTQDLKELMDTEHFNIRSSNQISKNEISVYGRSHLQQLSVQLDALLKED
jgi:hypothetical protein